jgi:hypothetical protein
LVMGVNHFAVGFAVRFGERSVVVVGPMRVLLIPHLQQCLEIWPAPVLCTLLFNEPQHFKARFPYGVWARAATYLITNLYKGSFYYFGADPRRCVNGNFAVAWPI